MPARIAIVSVMVTLSLAPGGCAVRTERQELGYGDYVKYSCDELGDKAVRLMRETASRSEHILEDDRARRESLRRQLKALRQASTDKQCD